MAIKLTLDKKNEYIIGRDESADIRLADKSVSRRHARIFYSDNRWKAEDLGSSNGTRYNSERMTGAKTLENGDEIRVFEFGMVFQGGTLAVDGPAEKITLKIADTDARTKDEKPTAPSKPYPFFAKSPRVMEAMPSGQIDIDPAPDIMQKPEFNWLSILLPVILMGVVSGVTCVATGSIGMLFSLPMMLSGIIISVINYMRQKKRFESENTLLHDRYEAYLESKRKELDEAAKKQRDLSVRINPDPKQCMKKASAKNSSLWERLSADPDFVSFRAGLGETDGCISVKVPKVGFTLHEKEYMHSPQEIADEFGKTAGIPVTVDLRRYPTLGVVGMRESVLGLVRSFVVQAATHCGYDELRLVFVFSEKNKDDWSWCRWLPHVWDDHFTSRLIICDQYSATSVLNPIESELRSRGETAEKAYSMRGEIPPTPFYLFVIDDTSLMEGQPIVSCLLSNRTGYGTGVVFTGASVNELPKDTSAIISASGKNSTFNERGKASAELVFEQDSISVDDCDRFARSLAPIRLPGGSAGEVLPNTITFFEGYGIEKPEDLQIDEYWNISRPEQTMAVPIGVRANGKPFEFDINEKAHGPHGLVAGTTGSGKSEMIQSWILSMAIQFSPQEVSFVLIDFKGTGLIQPFLELPHLAGTISDLDTNISRNLIALRAELTRRKELFDRSGAHNISEYMQFYRAGRVDEALSYLFVVIDEYAEFKVQYPDFTVEVDTLFRTGRALGVHIILLTQNPSGIISPQSENNIKFRWCLSVSSTAASKEVLGGHPEAAGLSNPGRAYVRIGNDEVFEKIQSYWSGAPYHVGGTTEKTEKASPEISEVLLSGQRNHRSADNVSRQRGIRKGTEILAAVKYLHEYTQKNHLECARAIWTAKMPYEIPLPVLLKEVGPVDPEVLAPVVGVIDDPWEQCQIPFALSLSEDGHAVVYGAPGSGKTTFLQTLILSMCMNYDPEHVNIYAMDFGGWTLSMFRDFPQVGEIANSDDSERIKRLAGMLTDTLDERKTLFAKEGVGSISAYNRVSEKKLPFICLIIDNFTPVLQLYPELDDFFVRLTREGGGYGLYMVATTSSTAGIGYRLQQNIKTNITLQLPSQGDYAGIIGRTNGLYPEAVVGRGLVRKGRIMEFQTALPGDSADDSERLKTIRAMASEMSDRWVGVGARQMKVMPDIVSPEDVRKTQELMLGLSLDTIEPVGIPAFEPHTLMISGIPGGGKTNAICLLACELSELSGINIGVYGDKNRLRFLQDRGCTLLSTPEELSEFMTVFSAELQRRKDDQVAGITHDNTPMALLIDDFDKLIDQLDDTTFRRVSALATVGEGLDAMLAVSCDNSFLAARRGLTPVLGKLTDSRALLIGGRFSQHPVMETTLTGERKNMIMDKYSAYLNVSGQTVGVKMIKAPGLQDQTAAE